MPDISEVHTFDPSDQAAEIQGIELFCWGSTKHISFFLSAKQILYPNVEIFINIYHGEIIINIYYSKIIYYYLVFNNYI